MNLLKDRLLPKEGNVHVIDLRFERLPCASFPMNRTMLWAKTSNEQISIKNLSFQCLESNSGQLLLRENLNLEFFSENQKIWTIKHCIYLIKTLYPWLGYTVSWCSMEMFLYKNIKKNRKWLLLKFIQQTFLHLTGDKLVFAVVKTFDANMPSLATLCLIVENPNVFECLFLTV